MPNKTAALRMIADALQASKKQMEPVSDAYDAGYRNLVHRGMYAGSEPYARMNGNVGAHFDMTGGPQALERARVLRSSIVDILDFDDIDPNMHPLDWAVSKYVEDAVPVKPLLARMQRPLFVTDDEINNPVLLANILGRDPVNRVNRASWKFPDLQFEDEDLTIMHPQGNKHTIPRINYFNPALQRRIVEKELAKKGFDSLVYPNDIENPRYSTRQSISPDLMSSLQKRRDFARSIVDTSGPVPMVDSATSKWFNPSGSVIDYSSLRDPFGERIQKRDWVTRGYRAGGLAAFVPRA